MTPGFAFVDAPLDRADELRGDAAALDALRAEAACLLLDARGEVRLEPKPELVLAAGDRLVLFGNGVAVEQAEQRLLEGR